MVELVEERAGPESEIMVSRIGEGPPLVLIHGIGGGRWTWNPVIEDLANRYELFIYDQRGHGSSHKPNQGYLLSDYAADLDLVLDHYGIDRPLILGHSLGGMAALEWATGQADRARALVIEDSPMHHGGEIADELFANWIALCQMSPEDAEAAYLEAFPEMDPDSAHARGLSITATALPVFTELRDFMLPRAGASVIATYRDIESPVLLVHGDVEQGGMVPVDDATAFTATVRNGVAVRIPDGGHGLHDGKTEDFLATVVPFLAAHSQ